jgi:hypothetical protein
MVRLAVLITPLDKSNAKTVSDLPVSALLALALQTS